MISRVMKINKNGAKTPYVDAVFAKGAALDNCFGFVDGTVRPICRPGKCKELYTMDTNVYMD